MEDVHAEDASLKTTISMTENLKCKDDGFYPITGACYDSGQGYKPCSHLRKVKSMGQLKKTEHGELEPTENYWKHIIIRRNINLQESSG